MRGVGRLHCCHRQKGSLQRLPLLRWRRDQILRAGDQIDFHLVQRLDSAMNRIFARQLSTLLLTALPVCATFAQSTGGPASFQHQSSPTVVDSLHAKEQSQIGSYQRHLMANGMSEDEA